MDPKSKKILQLLRLRQVNLPKGSGYVEFKARDDAEKAQLHMDGAQTDGRVVQAKFTLPETKKVSPPPKPLTTGPRRNDNASVDLEKDGPRRVTPDGKRGRIKEVKEGSCTKRSLITFLWLYNGLQLIVQPRLNVVLKALVAEGNSKIYRNFISLILEILNF